MAVEEEACMDELPLVHLVEILSGDPILQLQIYKDAFLIYKDWLV